MRTQRINMLDYIKVLMMNPLFEGISEDEIERILACSDAQKKHYEKLETIVCEHSKMTSIGIILSGGAQATKLDISGKRFVLSNLAVNSVFGDVLSVGSSRVSPVTVTAMERSEVLFVPMDYIITYCSKMCVHHIRLFRNMLNIVSEKFFELHNRINCIIKPGLREKLMYFLSEASSRADSRIFSIPFSRAELAEYLNADRSAVSRELSKMKKEGIIDYHKNSFKLISDMSSEKM